MENALKFMLAMLVGLVPPTASHPRPDPLVAQPQDEVYVRLVDVGAGLCCIASIPGGHHVVYDAGNYESQGKRVEAVEELIPEGEDIDLMVLSHSDSDHLGAVPEICERYSVKRVWRGGGPRTSNTWKLADEAVRLEREEGCDDMNLMDQTVLPGSTLRIGDAFVTMVCGFHEPPGNWDLQNESERQNAGSIVVRLEYAGRSVLFCGDTVGRHIGSPNSALIAAERFMVEMTPAVRLDSDAIVAPHHGADNGSSTAFIQAVSPEFVVFSAGHKYEHPRQAAAERYLANGIELGNMFRTDLGDDEGAKEWAHGREPGHNDPVGDDDVEIVIREDGSMICRYRQEH
jgi:competence protein ComEC